MMFLSEFNDFFAEKFEQKRRNRKWRPINIFANSLENQDKRIYVEITEDHHNLIKNISRMEDVDMKDFMWIVIEKGTKDALNYICMLKEELRGQLPCHRITFKGIIKKIIKKIFWWIILL